MSGRAGSTRRWRRQRKSVIDEVRRQWRRDPTRPPRCAVCGDPLDPEQPYDKGRNPWFIEVDHIVPRLGGPLETDMPWRLRPLHRRCNRERHRTAAAPPPPPAEQLGLFTPEAP